MASRSRIMTVENPTAVTRGDSSGDRVARDLQRAVRAEKKIGVGGAEVVRTAELGRTEGLRLGSWSQKSCHELPRCKSQGSLSL